MIRITHSLPFRLSLYICSILLLILFTGMSLIGWLWFKDRSMFLYRQSASAARETTHTLDRIFIQAEQTAQLIAQVLELQYTAQVSDTIKTVSVNSNTNDIDSNSTTSFKQTNKYRQGNIDLIETVLRSVNSKCPEIQGIAIAWKPQLPDPSRNNDILIGYFQNETYHLFDSSQQRMDYRYKDWFIVPVTLEKPVWTVPFLGQAITDTTLISYSTPFYTTIDGKRTIAGVVIADVPIAGLAKCLQNTQMAGIQQLSRCNKLFATNQFGQIVISPDDDSALSKTVFTIADEPDEPDPNDRKALQSMFRTAEGTIELTKTPFLDQPCQLFYSSCINDWVVCIVIPVNWATCLLLPVLLRFLGCCVIGMCLIILVIFIISRRVNRPLVDLSRAAEAIGQGQLGISLPDPPRDDEIGSLTRSFVQMQHELADYIEELKITVAAKERTESQLSIARAIQQDILPHILPPFTGFSNIYGAAALIPAQSIGGDLYDVFPVDDENLALIIGDVSGKGVPAALFMAITQTLQRSIAGEQNIHPGLLATRLNDMLSSTNNANMFVTYWVGILNFSTGQLKYTNCGHNPPIFRKASGTVHRLTEVHGVPLGIMTEYEYSYSEIQLCQGDSLILYTDGITEAFNPDEELFGDQRLIKTIQQTHNGNPAYLLETIENAVFNFRQDALPSDDLTLLIVEYNQKQSSDTETVPETDPETDAIINTESAVSSTRTNPF